MIDEPRAGDRLILAERGGNQAIARRGTYALPVACFLLSIVLLAVVTVLDARAAAAQSPAIGLSLLAQEGGGRELGPSDWVNHIPLALGAALLVIAVDAFVIIKFIRGRRRRG